MSQSGFRPVSSPQGQKRKRSESCSSDVWLNEWFENGPLNPANQGYFRESPEHVKPRRLSKVNPNDMVFIYKSNHGGYLGLPDYVKKGKRDDPILKVTTFQYEIKMLENIKFTDEQKKKFECFQDYANVFFKGLIMRSDTAPWEDPIGYEKREDACCELMKKDASFDFFLPLIYLYDALVHEAGFTNGCGKRALEAIFRISRLILFHDNPTQIMGGLNSMGPSLFIEDNFGIRVFKFETKVKNKLQDEEAEDIREQLNFEEERESHSYTADVCMYKRKRRNREMTPYLFGECKSHVPDDREIIKQTWIQSLRGLRTSTDTCGIGISRNNAFLILSSVNDKNLITKICSFDFRLHLCDDIGKFWMKHFFELIERLAKIIQDNTSDEDLIF